MARYIDGSQLSEGRYFILENGVQVSQVSLGPELLTKLKAEAREKKIALIEVIRRREGVRDKEGVPIIQADPETPLVLALTEGETAAQATVPPHQHEEHEHEPHEHPPHGHDDKANTEEITKLRGDLLGHGHDDYAGKIHGHKHLEDSVVHAQESTTRLGIEVAKVAESIATHDHELVQHGHKGYADENHEHDLAALLSRIAGLDTALAAALERITYLEQEPLPEHDHDNYAPHAHSHDEEAKVTGRRRNAPAHEHVWDTKAGKDNRWRCGICGAVKV